MAGNGSVEKRVGNLRLSRNLMWAILKSTFIQTYIYTFILCCNFLPPIVVCKTKALRTNEQPIDFYLLQQVNLRPTARRKEI